MGKLGRAKVRESADIARERVSKLLEDQKRDLEMMARESVFRTPINPFTGCKCTFAQKFVGDGCDICNPGHYADSVTEEEE